MAYRRRLEDSAEEGAVAKRMRILKTVALRKFRKETRSRERSQKRAKERECEKIRMQCSSKLKPLQICSTWYALCFMQIPQTKKESTNYWLPIIHSLGFVQRKVIRCARYSKKELESNDILIHFVEFSNVHNSDRISNVTQSNF